MQGRRSNWGSEVGQVAEPPPIPQTASRGWEADPIGKTAANVLVDTLIGHGVERIYGVAGDSLDGITDSIRARGFMAWTAVRHEETAAFAAGA
jgi:hypothetical protein